MLFSPQIPLQLQEPRGGRLEDFVPGPNLMVVEAIKSIATMEGASLFLHGPRSCGKSHLLSAACAAARARERQAWYIGLKRLDSGAQAALQGLLGLVCFDDLQAVAGDRQWEEALFHCFNETLESGGQIIVTSRLSPSAHRFSLPDLASRVAWGTTIRLEQLGETDRCRVLQDRARRLGVNLPEEVLQYLMRRMDRGLGSLLDAVEALGRAALAGKRRVTIPLAREVLALATPDQEA